LLLEAGGSASKTAELDDIGILEFDSGGAGHAKRPVLAYDGLEIDIPFSNSDEHAGAAAS
jgi:predicted transcriptional regulator